MPRLHVRARHLLLQRSGLKILVRRWGQLEATLRQTDEALQQYETKAKGHDARAVELEAEITRLDSKIAKGSRAALTTRLANAEAAIEAAAHERERALCECRTLQAALSARRAEWRAANPVDVVVRPTSASGLALMISIAG